MRIKYEQRDFGHAHGFGVKRGPFRHGVRVLTLRGTRVSRRKRALAVRALRAWVKTTRAPKFKLQVMRMRLTGRASSHHKDTRTATRCAALRP